MFFFSLNLILFLVLGLLFINACFWHSPSYTPKAKLQNPCFHGNWFRLGCLTRFLMLKRVLPARETRDTMSHSSNYYLLGFRKCGASKPEFIAINERKHPCLLGVSFSFRYSTHFSFEKKILDHINMHYCRSWSNYKALTWMWFLNIGIHIDIQLFQKMSALFSNNSRRFLNQNSGTFQIIFPAVDSMTYLSLLIFLLRVILLLS